VVAEEVQDLAVVEEVEVEVEVQRRNPGER